ncbi:MAG: spermidine/putrescine ABC transporter substrate-binding protein [Gemmatimonadales bacterium]
MPAISDRRGADQRPLSARKGAHPDSGPPPRAALRTAHPTGIHRPGFGRRAVAPGRERAAGRLRQGSGRCPGVQRPRTDRKGPQPLSLVRLSGRRHDSQFREGIRRPGHGRHLRKQRGDGGQAHGRGLRLRPGAPVRAISSRCSSPTTCWRRSYRKYLTNWGNVAPLFLDPAWDPGNVHSSPWGWGTTGIAYRTDLIPAAPDSWAVFLDPAYSGKMTMLDDLRDVIGSFLRYRGHSLNSTDPAELAQAKQDAIAAKPHLKAYLSAPVKGQLIAGDVWLAQLWSGDAAQATAEKPEIAFVVPKEGSMIFVDALVVPRSAPHPRAAHEFINYVLRPEVAAAIADKTGYGTPNQAAAALTQTKVPYPRPRSWPGSNTRKTWAPTPGAWTDW